MRAPNKVGGGAQTNKNGLEFERSTRLLNDIAALDLYTVKFYNEKEDCGEILDINTKAVIATYFEKYNLYKLFFEPNGMDYKKVISRRLLPDGCLIMNKTACIIEKKYQGGGGSVDEKLQTCDFKIKQYRKLFNPIGIKVRYIYLLNDWFDQDSLKDVFEYIHSVGCEYYIREIPLKDLGFK